MCDTASFNFFFWFIKGPSSILGRFLCPNLAGKQNGRSAVPLVDTAVSLRFVPELCFGSPRGRNGRERKFWNAERKFLTTRSMIEIIKIKNLQITKTIKILTRIYYILRANMLNFEKVDNSIYLLIIHVFYPICLLF